MSVVHDLQQDAPYVLMGLLDLVEEHHRPGLAPYLFGQLSAVLVAHIARGRADQPADAVLLHILRHVQADHGLLVGEHRRRQRAAQLRLAHAGGAQEQEAAHRAARIPQAHPAAPDGSRHGGHSLVLTHHPLFQLCLQILQAQLFILIQSRYRDVGPLRYHLGHLRGAQVPGLPLHMQGSRGLVQ